MTEPEFLFALTSQDISYNFFLIACLPTDSQALILEATSKNPKLCVTPFAEVPIYLFVNSAFGSVANLDFGGFGACLEFLEVPYM